MVSDEVIYSLREIVEAFNNKDCVFVIRCKNCEYYGESSGFCGHKSVPECFKPPKDFYCKYAERKNNND